MITTGLLRARRKAELEVGFLYRPGRSIGPRLFACRMSHRIRLMGSHGVAACIGSSRWWDAASLGDDRGIAHVQEAIACRRDCHPPRLEVSCRSTARSPSPWGEAALGEGDCCRGDDADRTADTATAHRRRAAAPIDGGPARSSSNPSVF